MTNKKQDEAMMKDVIEAFFEANRIINDDETPIGVYFGNEFKFPDNIPSLGFEK